MWKGHTGSHFLASYSMKYIRTMKDVYTEAEGVACNKTLLKVKPSFKLEQPKTLLRDYYNARNNTGLIRQIYNRFIYEVIQFVINGEGAVIMPESRLPSKIFIQFKHRYDTGRRGFNSFLNNRRLPHLVCEPYTKKRKEPYNVFISSKCYQTLVDNFNSSMKFSPVPYSYKEILPRICALYEYIEPDSIKNIVVKLHSVVGIYLRSDQVVEFNPTINGEKLKILFYKIGNYTSINFDSKRAYVKFERRKEIYSKMRKNGKIDIEQL